MVTGIVAELNNIEMQERENKKKQSAQMHMSC